MLEALSKIRNKIKMPAFVKSAYLDSTYGKEKKTQSAENEIKPFLCRYYIEFIKLKSYRKQEND